MLFRSADDNAFTFILEHQEELFPKIPILFMGVSDQFLALKQNENPYISGIIETADISDTVQMAKTLIPETSSIIALTDDTPSSDNYIASFYETKKEFPQLDFSHYSLKQHTFNELRKFLNSLDKETAVILISALNDKIGTNYTFEESLDYIRTYSKAPVYHLWRHGIGDGLLGGSIINLEYQARITAENSLKLLSEEIEINELAVSKGSSFTPIIDHRQMNKWGISQSAVNLVPDVQIINKPFTFMEEYKSLIVIITIIFSSLLIIIILLFLHIIYRKRTVIKLNDHVNHLQLLHEIDQKITRHNDFHKNLIYIIGILQKNYLCDDIVIHSFNSADSSLTVFASSKEISNLQESRFLSIEGLLPSELLKKRSPVFIPSIHKNDKTFDFFHREYENYTSYYGMPLIRDGETFGTLELLFKEEFIPKDDWLHQINTIKNQISLAFDKYFLFDEIYTSKKKLEEAYDSTLESFAKILEFRDKETENHTSRVTEKAISFAEYLGLSEQDITNIRRGSLLHDIGKLIVPDNILHKPGALNEREWEIMKSHTTLAYKSLQHISFLQDAVTIPYSHHEHWDGSGYPLGLKGKQIPLYARIFSIIDVWDALSTSRPYRKAWNNEKTITYMKDNSGKFFDPELLNDFFSMMEET